MQDSNVLITDTEQSGIPVNVRCPCRCTFCYESKFSALFPWIKTKFIQPYTDRTFDSYQKIYGKHKVVLADEGIKKVGNEFQYLPHCDFFFLGLTDKQIERLILNHKERGKPLTVYTTGFNADFKLIKYLSLKYPNIFKVHLSVVTFDSTIRCNTMNPNIDLENIEKICRVLIQPTYFLIYFNKRQIISDVEILNKYTIKNQGVFYIHKLYYNKLSPKYIIDYANKAEEEFEGIIYYLKINDKRLKDVSRRLFFSPDAKIYASALRNRIAELLQPCEGASDEAIFCSPGAYPVIRSLTNDDIHVIPIKSCWGGNIDFTQGMTIKAILFEIRKILANNVALRCIYIPDAMFCIEGKYDLNCDSINLIREAYPEIEINVIKVPKEILSSTVTLNGCISYYINEIKRNPTVYL